MSDFLPRNDLIVLTADKDAQLAFRALLTRHRSLGIRPLRFEVHSHPQKDPGCFRRGTEFLRMFAHQFAHALLVFDLEGCGQQDHSREQLERQVERRLMKSGWADRAAVIVLDPELEIWLWADSPHVGRALGWQKSHAQFLSWLREQNLIENRKPHRPKEAVQRVLRATATPWSASIHQRLARTVGLRRCQDLAFAKLQTVLRRWFA